MPRARATAGELLKHKFFHKRGPDALRTELLDRIDTVGTHILQDITSDASTEDVLDSIETVSRDRGTGGDTGKVNAVEVSRTARDIQMEKLERSPSTLSLFYSSTISFDVHIALPP